MSMLNIEPLSFSENNYSTLYDVVQIELYLEPNKFNRKETKNEVYQPLSFS
jgi:hypothetical protein